MKTQKQTEISEAKDMILSLIQERNNHESDLKRIGQTINDLVFSNELENLEEFVNLYSYHARKILEVTDAYENLRKFIQLYSN